MTVWNIYYSYSAHLKVRNYFKNIFSTSYLTPENIDLQTNVAPLKSVIGRISIESYGKANYIGQEDPDNTWDEEQYQAIKHAIDCAYDKVGWVILAGHFYRPCYKNYIEGSNYNKTWTFPLNRDEIANMDSNNYWEIPPSRLGITSWADWYPCPGTRLAMIYDLICYAIEKGLKNVSYKEGLKYMGNIEEEGYYTNGMQLLMDKYNIEGSIPSYPYYVVGANGVVKQSK